MGTLKHDLLRPGMEFEETHISWVFLGARDVWKVKKPVDLGFLDFTTLERRRSACVAEVRLNRRLAPTVYHGIVPITRGPGGRHRIGGAGEVVDWAVHMARLPLEHRMDRRVASGELDAAHIGAIAAHLARFHQAARCDDATGRFGTPEAVAGNVRENFDQTRDRIAAYLRPEEAREIERKQLGFLRRRGTLLTRRIAEGRVRDGHGDLRLEHVYVDERGAVTVIDCIEFNDRFRYGDVCADIAFLSMDLAWHGRPDAAEWLLAAYAREANDFDLYALVDFYEAYRAYVRGKVSTMIASDPAVDAASRDRAVHDARRFFLLALAAERRPLVPPAVVAVGGVIASGKSTVAERLAAEMAAPVVDTDRTRKFLLRVPPVQAVREPPWRGAYAPELTASVYDEVFRRAGVVLSSERAVVLDASFRTRDLRAAARRLARDHGARFCFVECRAPAGVCRERLRQRARGPAVSDGRLEIFDDFVARWEPVTELPEAEHVVVDTTEAPDGTVRELRARLPLWPAGLAG